LLLSFPVFADNKAGKLAYEAGDYETAFSLWKIEAEKGNPKAQFSLAEMYRDGVGVEKNHKDALRWFMAAAENGYLDAYACIGQMHIRGRGTEENIDLGLQWITEGAEKGNVLSQYTLGLTYLWDAKFDFDKDSKNCQLAWKWLLLAAESGHILSQGEVARMLYYGVCVEKDYSAAAKLAHPAAERGDLMSQELLAEMYENGHGVKKDIAEAIKWTLIAYPSVTFDKKSGLFTKKELKEGKKRAKMWKLIE
jgi:TPR repeat protein